jgi:glycine/serine hydroxymethyltransferase
MGTAEMAAIAGWLVEALRRPDDAQGLDRLRQHVLELALRFPVPGV